MKMRNGFSLRASSMLIGSAHLLLLGLRLHERIWELIELAEPFLLGDNVFILTSYLAQILAVILLVVGIITKRLMFTIPWILLTTVLFSSGTIFAVTNFGFEEFDQIVINFFVVGVVWTAWYTILKYNLDYNEYLSNIPNYIRKYKDPIRYMR